MNCISECLLLQTPFAVTSFGRIQKRCPIHIPATRYIPFPDHNLQDVSIRIRRDLAGQSFPIAL
ncbi:hypothetical protein D3C87_1314990 [compost metagenome]